MMQGILLCGGGQLIQAADGDLESKDLFVLHKADVPQRKKRPGIQVAAFACLCSTVGAEQCSFFCVQIE